MTLKYFGMIADITKKKEEQLFFENKTITLCKLQSKLEEKYPELKNTSYSFAVNQSLTKENAELNNTDEIALLPPFAGG
ncbi:MoaD/ThiS family protein [uncultured Flavobacterium sp.]|uniref:MoaD/ThiS family protein n=1 Tax=uncultured Flavobacterium sp. TaxID=165435 RepID=UPI0030CA4326